MCIKSAVRRLKTSHFNSTFVLFLYFHRIDAWTVLNTIDRQTPFFPGYNLSSPVGNEPTAEPRAIQTATNPSPCRTLHKLGGAWKPQRNPGAPKTPAVI